MKPIEEEKSEYRVRKDIDQQMQTRVRDRLQQESNGGQIVLTRGQITAFIGEELQHVIDNG